MTGVKGIQEPEVYKDIYDYIDDSNKKDTPKRGLDDFKQLEPKTTTQQIMGSRERMGRVDPIFRKSKNKLRKRTSKKKKNVEIFYRRTEFDGSARDKPQKWTHCLVLLSPFLNGYISNLTETKQVVATDMSVRRLAYLLNLNMTDATNEEIRAVLVEISRLQLRLFQWDTNAIKAILNVLCKDYLHTFKGVKYGIKTLFHNWKLNTSNLTRLLSQSRIFRPPCMQVTDYGGSTVTPYHSRFSKKPTKVKCNRRHHDDEDCIDDTNY
ncbi:hypothetical protein PYW07_012669 [Mythimna separata]|uniref:Uncharacterized protein n=1 Tax=Mythimna separata TaxID=271217 RepID=A0AAD7Y8T2_MYTSE|nr:hypothetical protein PYW07_012669 [Mythimna separata]